MKIKDYKDAQAYYIKDDRGDATGAFAAFVREPSSMDQEPRNMYAGGQLVQPSDDGSRPGYSGVEPIKYQAATKLYRLNIVPSKFGPGIEVRNKDKAVLESLYKKYLDNNPEYKKHITYLENYESDIKKLSKTNTQTEALDAIEKKYGFKPSKNTVSGKFKFKPRKYKGSKGSLWSKILPEKYTTKFIEAELKNGKSSTQMAKEIFQSDPEKYLKLAAGKELTGSTLEGYTKKRIADRIKGRIEFIPKLNKINQNILEKTQTIKKLENPEGKRIKDAKRYANLKMTDPTKASGIKKFQYHHVRQIAGGVPLTTDDVLIIDKKINAQIGGATNKALNRMSEAIQKNNRLALEAMNAKNEGLALEYMKRSDNLNAQAEKIVNSAIDKLPKKYKGYVGFNQFSLPTNEYGLPISNEPMIIKKVGGMPVSKDAIDLTTLSRKDKAKFKKIVKQQAEAGKTGPINKTKLSNLLKVMKSADPQTARQVGVVLNSGFPVEDIAREIAKIPGAKKFARGFMKIGGPFEVAFLGLDIANEVSKGAPLDTSFQTGLSNITFGALGNPEKYQMRDLKDAANELGVKTKGFQELKNLLDLEKQIAAEKQLLEDMKSYNEQTEGSTLKGNFDVTTKSTDIQNLEKLLSDKSNELNKLSNIDTLFEDYVNSVQYLGRKEYNKTLDSRKDRVYPDMGSMGSDFMTTIMNPIQSFLPQNLMETGLGPFNKATQPVVRNLRKIPFIGGIFDPTSDQAKLSAMSQDEKDQRALDMNIIKQNYHPVMGQTMTGEQLEPYYEKFFSKGGIASLTKTIPPESGPMSEGLRSLYNNDMDY